jgi:uncharacterized protein (TIGR00251 family)
MMLRVESNLEMGAVIFAVRVQARARKDEIVGEIDGALKVRLRAPALEGRANEALVEFLAGILNTSQAAVRILGGERSRLKRVEVRGVTEKQVLGLLGHEA